MYYDDLRTENNVPTVNIHVYGTETDTKLLAGAWREAFGSKISVYQGVDHKYDAWFVSMNARLANKAHAAQMVADLLGIPRDQAMAVGDEINDLELLVWAGMGICMGDGHAEVRAQADYVTGTQAENGVALAIERFVLG